MRIALTLCGAVLAAVASFSTAQATTLSGNLTADNLFDAYISTDDNTLGTLITSGTNWPTVIGFTGQALTAGVTNYLHIVATDQGKPDMFIGSFSLSDSLFKFANGTQSLVTDVANWRSDVGGVPWFAPTGTPVNLGPDGTNPWGNRVTGATYIWAATDPTQSFFSTAITPVVAATPIPGALPLLVTALGGLGFLARRRRQTTSV